MRKGVVCLNRLEPFKYNFLSIKIRAQRAQEQIRAQGSPTGTACLIGKAPQIWHRINALQPPPAPPGAPKHPRWVYPTLLPPKYKISHLKSHPIPPNVPNSEHNHLTAIIDVCLHIPALAELPLHAPPSHPAPSASQPPYPPNQKTLLLILTSPGTTAILCFFGWWGFAHMHL